MSKKEIFAILLMLMATVGTIGGILGVENMRRSRLYTLELIARAPEHGNWHPRTITVQRGQPVRLLIRNIETVSHGFALPDFAVGIKEIKAGHVKTLEFTPDRSGSFPFLCTVWCSPYHEEMTGTLIVE